MYTLTQLSSKFAFFKANGRDPDDQVLLNYDQREKSRFKVTTLNQIECAVVLPREATKGQALRGGQVLAGQDADGKAVGVVVMAAYEPVYQVTCHTPKELARLAFHLGNRHTPLQLLDEEQSDHGMHYSLRIRVDSVLKDMLHGLDAHIHEALQPFEPESGAYAQTTHAHDHAHDSHEHGHEGHVHTAECGHDHAPPADEATTLAQRDDPVHIVRIHRPGQAPIERAIKGPGHHSH